MREILEKIRIPNDNNLNYHLIIINGGSLLTFQMFRYESIATVGEIRVWWRADFQSGSRVLKKVF